MRILFDSGDAVTVHDRPGTVIRHVRGSGRGSGQMYLIRYDDDGTEQEVSYRMLHQRGGETVQ